MHCRTILSGTLAILLLSGASHARDSKSTHDPSVSGGPGITLPLPTLGLSALFGAKKTEQPVQMAQVSDPRVIALEEQIRKLSGTIEEMNFQILQMQEQMRKMQEDNEFRFQELEKKKSDAGGPTNDAVAAAPQSPPAANEAAGATAGGEASPAAPSSVEEVIVDNGGAAPDAPSKTFGTITFDAKGNVTGGAIGDQIVEGPATDGSGLPASATDAVPKTDGTMVAALPATDNPEELYRNSYEFILSGDYGTAEAGFRDHIDRFPTDAKTADARFWLGESLLGQKKYRDAAEMFLAANKQYPSSKKAPDMLLKLGVSLVALDQRDVACATFSEISKRYPDATSALKERVKQEEALASC